MCASLHLLQRTSKSTPKKPQGEQAVKVPGLDCLAALAIRVGKPPTGVDFGNKVGRGGEPQKNSPPDSEGVALCAPGVGGVFRSPFTAPPFHIRG